MTLSNDPANVGLARTFASLALERWNADVDIETVKLAISEIVTNAFVHADSDVAITIHLDDDTVRVEIADTSRRPPVVRHPAPDEATGRGMNIVEAVTGSWGVDEVDGGGKVVWFTIAVHPVAT